MRKFADHFARLLSAAMLAAMVLSLLAPETQAQLGRRTFATAPKLTRGDISIIRKLVREELTTKPDGTTLPWNNPDSSNSGTVTLMSNFASQGRKCWRVRYDIKPGVQQPAAVRPATYMLNNCRLPDGSWHIDSQARPDAK